MGEAQCNHSDNIDHRLTKKTLAAISVGETVGPLSWGSAKYWSEWQDLNLRPPRPERDASERAGTFLKQSGILTAPLTEKRIVFQVTPAVTPDAGEASPLFANSV